MGHVGCLSTHVQCHGVSSKGEHFATEAYPWWTTVVAGMPTGPSTLQTNLGHRQTSPLQVFDAAENMEIIF